jgi:hypothetical protein
MYKTVILLLFLVAVFNRILDNQHYGYGPGYRIQEIGSCLTDRDCDGGRKCIKKYCSGIARPWYSYNPSNHRTLFIKTFISFFLFLKIKNIIIEDYFKDI